MTVRFDMTAKAHSTNYFPSLISDSSGTEPQQGHLALMLQALCEYIYTADGLGHSLLLNH